MKNFSLIFELSLLILQCSSLILKIGSKKSSKILSEDLLIDTFSLMGVEGLSNQVSQNKHIKDVEMEFHRLSWHVP